MIWACSGVCLYVYAESNKLFVWICFRPFEISFQYDFRRWHSWEMSILPGKLNRPEVRHASRRQVTWSYVAFQCAQLEHELFLCTILRPLHQLYELVSKPSPHSVYYTGRRLCFLYVLQASTDILSASSERGQLERLDLLFGIPRGFSKRAHWRPALSVFSCVMLTLIFKVVLYKNMMAHFPCKRRVELWASHGYSILLKSSVKSFIKTRYWTDCICV